MRLPHHIAAHRARLLREIAKYSELVAQRANPVTPQQKRALTLAQRVVKNRTRLLAELNQKYPE